jgi:hypothetical protein
VIQVKSSWGQFSRAPPGSKCCRLGAPDALEVIDGATFYAELLLNCYLTETFDPGVWGREDPFPLWAVELTCSKR